MAPAVSAVGPATVRVDIEREVLPGVTATGQGSGFFFHADGRLLTNEHVIREAHDGVSVTLTDGRKFVAKVLGVDPVLDLAVLKVEPPPAGSGQPPLPVAPLADSDELAMGDFVIALGNPLGLDSTATLGIVSNAKRAAAQIGASGEGPGCAMIQTDAAINPGNSGGPLVSEWGEVVGINTCMLANGRGLGFAIPINKAKEVLADLSEGKHINHPYLGISCIDITPNYARESNEKPNSQFFLPEVEGTLIVRVAEHGPSALPGGLRAGDVVQAVGGAPVQRFEQLRAALEARGAVGEPLEITVIRGGVTQTVEVIPEDTVAVKAKEEKMRKQLDEKMREFEDMLPPHMRIIPPRGGGRGYGLP